MAVDGIAPVQGDDATEALLARAEAAASDLLANDPAEEVPHVAAWREAHRAFGTKLQRTRNSLEVLLRRASTGLPRVNDRHLQRDQRHPPGPAGRRGPRPARQPATADPCHGIGCDNQGVTCRRWNWRQGRRTQLSPNTTSAPFILDAPAPMSDGAPARAGGDLTGHLQRIGPAVRVATRVLPPRCPSAV